MYKCSLRVVKTFVLPTNFFYFQFTRKTQVVVENEENKHKKTFKNFQSSLS